MLVDFTSAELYDPSTGTWSAAGSMSVDRPFSTATLLVDGRVLVAGGFPGGGTDNGPLQSAEIFSPTGSVTLVITGDPRSGPYAVEAQTMLTGALTVNFFVDGNFFHQESVYKYCLFGGDAACGTGTLGAGAHTIKAQVMAQGSSTVLAEAQITVTE